MGLPKRRVSKSAETSAGPAKTSRPLPFPPARLRGARSAAPRLPQLRLLTKGAK